MIEIWLLIFAYQEAALCIISYLKGWSPKWIRVRVFCLTSSGIYSCRYFWLFSFWFVFFGIIYLRELCLKPNTVEGVSFYKR